MEDEHWPTVSQAVKLLPPVSGNYLEVGVGNGYALRYFAENGFCDGRCFGLDISPEMIRKTGDKLAHLPHVHLESADFLTWKPPDNIRFDLIFSMEVFYYFPHIQDGFDRAVSLLSPGGILMILVNYYEENVFSHGWPEQLKIPMQRWSINQYLEGFGAAGLSDISQKQVKHPKYPDEPGTLVTWGRKMR